tara:strand:+ start:653 stop:889 length:237 start_codon:yes stop_codon:yes gene_type:complete
MISARQSSTRQPSARVQRMREERRKKTIQVWSEPKKGGKGYVIYAGIPGTDKKTYAGSAMSRDTLEMRLRIAKAKFER